MFNKIVSDTYIFNKVGGCPVTDSVDNLRGGLKLIIEEYDETESAVEALDESLQEGGTTEQTLEALVDLADGAADIIVTAIGLLYRGGFNQSQVEDILTAVGEANKAKFALTEDEAIESVEMYEDDPRYFDVQYEKRGNRYVIFGKMATSNGVVRKILKSSGWTAPEDTIRKIILEEN